MGDIRSVLSSIGERADDLQRTLASFDGERLLNWSSSLTHYQQLSQQLQLLHDKSSDQLLDHFVPEPAGVGEQPSLIPNLLSTRLVKEQEDERNADAEQARAKADASDTSEEALSEHNRKLEAAHEHLASRALELGLPGAASLAGGRAGASGAAARRPLASAPGEHSAGGGRGADGTAAARPPDPAAAKKLLAVLRTGQGTSDAKRQRV
mgnify:CR=1 FL=1|tara:strand:+ start:67 stop:693 length:627 start_codon:yes stop_codon:yes gene_type:complete